MAFPISVWKDSFCASGGGGRWEGDAFNNGENRVWASLNVLTLQLRPCLEVGVFVCVGYCGSCLNFASETLLSIGIL